jgi:DNA invertase Pin-like site-specific DNA recombinase
MCKIYGYVRVSTVNQKTQRQIDNIKSYNSDAIIREEKQSGKDIENRTVFKKLLSDVRSGDTIIFDEVSRMSRNAAEGYELYMNLMEHGINLIFLKEHHIDTDEYKRRTENHIQKIESQNDNISKLINGILDLVAEFEKENLKDNIRLAFEQAEHERLFLIKRVTEGKDKSEKHQGRPIGSTNQKTDKADHIKKIIREQSKDFEGKFSDAKIMREYLHIARNTYYKYKREMLAEG